ncbi:methyl-accepting chemotaxis protein [Thaumasiovibrio subtropicus]|uniref:methyl-accepting chemotaxis protein n=1 Tax=Thaumasiovibrio subtropicus TaxID=1891207 RepID=UPI00131D1F9B|nr:HAMP domain-containing methyl-accepting chemotaxis protein [Thaumasiovibrio subtropicus]
MKLSVKAKLGYAFGSIIGLMILTVGILWWIISGVYSAASVIDDDDLPGAIAYFALIDESGDVNREAWHIVNGTTDSRQEFDSNNRQFDEAFRTLVPLERSSKSGSVALDNIDSLMKGFRADFEQIRQIEDDQTRKQAMYQAEQKYFVPMEKVLDEMAAGEANDANEGLHNVTESLSNMLTVMLTLTGIATVFAIVIAYLLSSNFTRRLSALEVEAKKIAEGDLDNSVFSDKSGDELSALGHSVYQMRDSLKALIGSISHVSDGVQHVTQDVSSAGTAILAGSEFQSEKANLIATASEELTMTISEVAQQSNQTASLANDSGDAAQRGQAVIAELVTSIENASAQMSAMATEMHKLDESSSKIGNVIKVIEDIAEQTNLLALNAAIEAARAGEFGRGFAVVADEVRALAERTTSATQEVADMIKAIQEGTQSAVRATDTSRELVESGVSHSQHAVEALDSIVDAAGDLKLRVDAIATATEEQTSVTREIANDISAISDKSNELHQYAEQSAKSVDTLESNVTELNGLMAQFRIQ